MVTGGNTGFLPSFERFEMSRAQKAMNMFAAEKDAKVTKFKMGDLVSDRQKPGDFYALEGAVVRGNYKKMNPMFDMEMTFIDICEAGTGKIQSALATNFYKC